MVGNCVLHCCILVHNEQAIINKQKALNWTTMDFTSCDTEILMSTVFTFHGVEHAALIADFENVWSEKKHRMRFKQGGHRDI